MEDSEILAVNEARTLQQKSTLGQIAPNPDSNSLLQRNRLLRPESLGRLRRPESRMAGAENGRFKNCASRSRCRKPACSNVIPFVVLVKAMVTCRRFANPTQIGPMVCLRQDSEGEGEKPKRRV